MPGPPELPTLHGRAEDHLRYIRDTMARAAHFTAVPGWGGALMGATALATALVAGPPRDDWIWVAWWVTDAAVAAAIGLGAAARKARRTGTPLMGPAGRRFAFAFVPAVAAAVVLTFVFTTTGLTTRLPGCWLLLYGAAVTSGGASSVPAVPVMGMLFMGIGTLAFWAPTRWGHFFMAAGFGVLQIGFGALIARKYGG